MLDLLVLVSSIEVKRWMQVRHFAFYATRASFLP